MPIPRFTLIGSALTLLLLTPLHAVDVLFIGSGTSPSAGADPAVMNFLESRYGAAAVDYASSASVSTGDELAYDLLVISSTIGSSSARGKFHNSSVGILNWEEALADNSSAGEFALTGSATKESETSHTLRITTSHPVTSGFAVGSLVPVASGNTELWWSTGSQPAGATSVAADDDTASNLFLTIAETGGTLLNGATAPGRRIMFGMTDNSFDNLTAEGLQLFGQATDWTASASAPVTLPELTNTPASDILPASATVGGTVTATGNDIPDVTLHWGNNDGATNPNNWDATVTLGPQSSTFSSTISNLLPSTPYFFRTSATNSAGTTWASTTTSFTTGAAPTPPSLVNAAATGITSSSATAGGNITDTGGDPPSVTLFYGGNDGGTNPANWDDSVGLGVQSGSFSTTLFSLPQNTTLFYRARATNAAETVWAPSTESFTTVAITPPAITANTPTNVTGSTATASGQVTSTGGEAPLVTAFYGTSDGGTTPGSWDASIGLGPRSASFSTPLANLNPTTSYFVSFRATNAGGTAWTTPTQSFTTPEVSTVLINEFMASNDSTTVPNAVPGSFDDWIELINTSPAPVDISGWHLTDDPGNPTKWTFPTATTIAANGFLVVFATGNNTPDTNANFHTSFKLSAAGEPLTLVRPNLTVASGGTTYPSQDSDISYGLDPAGLDSVYFAVPTPGAANDPAGFLPVADTTFSPDRGFYDTEIDITITTATPGATIYVTTDGTEPIDSNGSPTATASAYTAPIHLTATTTVRTAAVKPGLAPTNIDTHTYFLMDTDPADPNGLNGVLTQTRPAGYGNLSSGDYNMDTAISQSATYRPRLLEGLQDIPTVSISLDKDDWAGATNGIYNHSGSRGFAWERPCSAEYIPAPGTAGKDWQVDCGIRVQGGASRNSGSSPKHSLSLRFRESYGAGKLRRKVFPDLDIDEFNVLAFRAGYNNSWIHRDAGQRSRASMIRDQWARDAMVDMGQHHGGHGIYVHLYINGLYWGVHNLCERQDAAHYATHNGRDEELIDARNGSEFTDGTSAAWNRMINTVNSGNWEAIQQILDVDNYIDYQIVNRYGANSDLKSNGNWRAAGGGPNDEPWQVYAWDTERTLESPGASNEPLDPMTIRSTLNGLPEYRLRFADRVQKHFFNDGALTPAQCAARWMDRANEIDLAIIAESARWGDHRQSSAYNRDNHWITEQNRLLTQYFPGRSNTVLGFFRSSGLYPSIDAPAFSVHGGQIDPTDTVSLSVSSGTIYYTLDGTDPRLPASGGGTSTVLLDEGDPATAFIPNTDIGTLWRNTTFNDGSWLSGTTGVGYERTPADYQGLIGLDVGAMANVNTSVYIRVPFTIPDQTTLDDIASLTLNMKYDDGFVAYLNGDSTVVAAANNPGTLDNTSGATGSHSDRLAVGYVAFPISDHIDKLQVGNNILAIHALNNGTGSSDLLITPQITYSDAPDSGGGLAPSAIRYTTPITLPASATITVRSVDNGTWTALEEATFYIEDLARTDDLRIAELNYHPPGDRPHEFIEIVNTATYPVNLDGCTITDGVSHTFANTRLAPGARLVVAGDLTEFQNHYGFPASAQYSGSLDNGGETITLRTAGGDVIDSFTYNDANSWPGRADGGGSSLEISADTLPSNDASSWRSSSEYGGSPGSAGTGPDRRVIINEVLAHTDLPQRDTVELFNHTASSIDISGWFLTDNNNVYKSFRIPTGTPPVPAGGYRTFDESAFNPLPTGSIQNYTGTPAAPPLTVQSNNHGLSDGDTITIGGYTGAPAYNDTFEVTVIDTDSFTVPTPFLDNQATRGSWTTGRPFALSASKGDKLWLLEADPDGTLISFVDNAEFPASVNGGTLGRYPDGEHNGPLYPLTTSSLGSVNQTARHGPVIITEIMYNPPATPDDNLEFIEIANTGSSLENLDHWRLRGGVDFDFGPSHSIAPGQVLVLVGFDPNNATLDTSFRTTYTIPGSVALIGPWNGGNLDNAGDTVRIQRPDSPPPGDPGFYPQLTEDEARYDDASPWPTSADGGGSSLDRQGTTLFGRLSPSWVAAPPTPGSNGITQSASYATWSEINFGAGSPIGSLPTDDPDLDGNANLAEFAAGTDPNSHGDTPPFTAAFQSSPGGDTLQVDFTRNANNTGVTTTVEWSTDLLTWTQTTSQVTSSSNGRETRRASFPATPGTRLYIRLHISQ